MSERRSLTPEEAKQLDDEQKTFIRKRIADERWLATQKARRLSSQPELLNLRTAIREFVWAEMRLAKAEITHDEKEAEKQREQSSRFETIIGYELETLDMRVAVAIGIAKHFQRLK